MVNGSEQDKLFISIYQASPESYKIASLTRLLSKLIGNSIIREDSIDPPLSTHQVTSQISKNLLSPGWLLMAVAMVVMSQSKGTSNSLKVALG